MVHSIQEFIANSKNVYSSVLPMQNSTWLNRRTMYVLRRLFLLCLAFNAVASPALLPVVTHVADKKSLQRGAEFFMNYCAGCHGLRYLRYNQLEYDLDLRKKSDYSPILASIPESDAKRWFGQVPPDLSLVAKAPGAAWVYTYLKSFYIDTSRPFNTNNVLFRDVAMPNVLAPLVGEMRLVPDVMHDDVYSHLLLKHTGLMTEQQFDNVLQDLVTFLVYVAEPSILIRYRIGFIVLFVLGILWILLYCLWRMFRSRKFM